MEKAKRGRPHKENSCNDVCRVCETNLKVTYGNCVAKSCVNLFKPSGRKETFGIVLNESLKNVGITVLSSNKYSQLACNACYRKIKNLCELFEFIAKRFAQEREEKVEGVKENSEGVKRKFLAVLSPAARGSPPNRKTVRTHSPGKKKATKKKRKRPMPKAKNPCDSMTAKNQASSLEQYIAMCYLNITLTIWIRRREPLSKW